MLHKGEGIIIRTIDYGETNKITTMFTREFGKLSLFARGAKKTRSRLSPVSQLFTYGNYLFFSGKGMGTLRQGEVIHAFRSLHEDVFRTAYAAYIAELLDKLTDEKESNPHLFELLAQSLHFMDEGTDAEVVSFIFETKMLAVAGIRPELNGCAHCGTKDGPFVFSVKEGGLLCLPCKPYDPHHFQLSEASAKLLRLFLYMDIRRLGRVSLKKETKQEMKKILSAYYDEYAGISLKSKRFLDQLDKMSSDLS